MARCNCDSSCSCLIVGSTTECIETVVTGTGTAANPYVITSEFTCLGPNAGGTLGYEEVVANQTGITAKTDLTGLTTTVTVGTLRRILISCEMGLSKTVADGLARLYVEEGATILTFRDFFVRGASEGAVLMAASVSLTPSAGSHTYKLSLEQITGTGTTAMDATANHPAYILVEDIGAA